MTDSMNSTFQTSTEFTQKLLELYSSPSVDLNKLFYLIYDFFIHLENHLDDESIRLIETEFIKKYPHSSFNFQILNKQLKYSLGLMHQVNENLLKEYILKNDSISNEFKENFIFNFVTLRVEKLRIFEALALFHSMFDEMSIISDTFQSRTKRHRMKNQDSIYVNNPIASIMKNSFDNYDLSSEKGSKNIQDDSTKLLNIDLKIRAITNVDLANFRTYSSDYISQLKNEMHSLYSVLKESKEYTKIQFTFDFLPLFMIIYNMFLIEGKTKNITINEILKILINKKDLNNSAINRSSVYTIQDRFFR